MVVMLSDRIYEPLLSALQPIAIHVKILASTTMESVQSEIPRKISRCLLAPLFHKRLKLRLVIPESPKTCYHRNH